MLRLLRRLAVLGGLAAAAAAAARAARSRVEGAPGSLELTPAPPTETSPPPARQAGAAPPPDPPAGRRSRGDLYREAQAVNLKGRSRMTRDELERALEERARGG